MHYSWYKFVIKIRDEDIVLLRSIIEGYENLCFMDKCSGFNNKIDVYATGFFYRETKEILEDFARIANISIISEDQVDEEKIILRYNRE